MPDSMPADSVDYPAAHSMDTVWWGVDRQGRLARFSTGEAGGLPAGAGGEPVDIDAIRVLSTGERPVFCDDLFPEPDGKLLMNPPPWEREQGEEGPIEVDEQTESFGSSFLLWLKDEAALQQILASPVGGQVTRLTVPGRIVVWVAMDWSREEGDEKLLSVVLRWQRQGLLLRGWLYDYGGLELERLGLFSYGHSFDNWICGPYAREGLPKAPVQLTDLPEEIQESLSCYALDHVDFERDVLFQPYEHGRADSWEGQWVSTTGAVRRTGGDAFEDAPEPETVAVQAPAGSTAAGLVAAYLRGDEGSVSVLGDWLEEQGRARLLEARTVGERLDEVLMRWFTPEQRLALEARFVEHLLEASLAPPELTSTVSAVVQAVRQVLEGQAEDSTLNEKANAAFSAWMPEFGDDEAEVDESSPQLHQRVAWAGWALGCRYPLVAARTARAIRPEELQYQLEQVLAAIG